MRSLFLAPAVVLTLGTAAIAQTPTPLSLSQATQTALTANPTGVASLQQFAQAQAKLAQARAQLRSQITFSSSMGVSNADVIQPPPNHETFGTLTNTINVPLPVGRRPRLAVQQAQEQLVAAQAQYDSARLGLIGQVNTAYYDLLRKQALLRIAKETEASATRQAQETEKRFRAGDVPELDVLRAQTPVASAQAGVIQAETDESIARQMLNGILSKPLDDPLAIEDVLDTQIIAPKMTLEEARTQALKNAPDVRAAEATERAQEIAKKSAMASRDPDYSLQASDARSSDRTAFSRLDNVQATISIPLSDGGLARAQRKEADAALLQAKAQTQVARQAAEVAVSAAYMNATSSLRQVEAAHKTQEIAQTAYDKTTLGYQRGLFPLTDVLNAQSALAQAKIAYTQAIYNAVAASATLNNALGILPAASVPQAPAKQ